MLKLIWLLVTLLGTRSIDNYLQQIIRANLEVLHQNFMIHPSTGVYERVGHTLSLLIQGQGRGGGEALVPLS